MSTLADNLARVRERIGAAALRAGRAPEDVTLVVVTKRQPAASVSEALAAGALDFGENYVQEAADKRGGVQGGRWHLMGHLQSNKAKQAVSLFDMVQSVDGVKLARTLGRYAQEQGKTQDILIQVLLGDEETKSGLAPDMVAEAVAELAALAGVSLHGLMGIAPLVGDPRPHFRHLRRLFEALPADNQRVLSMGMSGDFESAIEEGATMVRVGTAIFGTRH